MKINFIYGSFYDYDSKKFVSENVYKVTREVNEKESLKDIAIEIALEAGENGFHVDDGLKDLNQIFLNFSQITDEDPLNNFPNYYFNDKEEVIFFEGLEKYEYNWTLEELNWMKQKGYIKNDISTIYIILPQFGGAGDAGGLQLIQDLFFNHLLDLTIGYGLSLTVVGGKKVISGYKLRKIRKIAKYWVHEGSFRHIWQLKKFIIQKGNWEIEELSQKLRIDQEFSQILLVSLGYELQGNIYIPSYSDKAIQARKYWDTSEVKLRKFR